MACTETTEKSFSRNERTRIRPEPGIEKDNYADLTFIEQFEI